MFTKKIFALAFALMVMIVGFIASDYLHFSVADDNILFTTQIAYAGPFDGGLGDPKDGGCCDEGDKGGNDSPFDGGLGDPKDGGCCDDPTPPPPPPPDDPKCEDPAANNTGGHLPCTYTTPDPPVCLYLKANGETGTLNLPYGHNGNVDLTWASIRATGATLTPDGSSVAVNGSKPVTVTSDTTYTFVVTNADGSDTCKVTIDVAEEQELTCQDVVFDSNPSSPVYPGTSVNLSWVFTGNVTSATIDNGIGDAFARNNVDVVINDTITFNATIANATTNKVCPYTVTVGPVTDAPRCVLFEADPASHPYGGGLSTLEWEAVNADSITIDNGVLASTNVLKGTTDVNVTEAITYTMTVSAAGYDDVTCAAPITVGPINTSITCEDNVTSFKSNDYSLPRGGDNVTLTWTTTGVDAISINGVNSTNPNDSERVQVTSSKTFTMTIYDNGVAKDTCPLKITVATGGSGSSSSNPKCELDISDEKIKAGEEITLTWDTSRAKEVKIEDNHGNVLVNSDDSDDFDGKMTIKPTKDTEYTLFSIRGTKERKCEVEVEVENKVTVFETRTHDPRVAGISLTQVPYTGFEAGPALTMIFYTLLTVWGLFVAYIFAVRRDFIGGVSLAGAHDHVSFTDMSTTEAVEDTEAETKAESYVHAVAHTEAPVNLPTATPVIGYASVQETDEVDESIEMTELENRAHAQKVLLSSDAMRFFMNATEAGETRNEKLDAALAQAKASFPSEAGWVALNLARLETLITDDKAAEEVETQTEAITGGSLAEAIVTGNVVAAYQMIAHRPMIALADAAADLDAVYRSRKGETVTVSNMLVASAAAVSTESIEAAITALTGALDGTYDSEENAVKMAIMKAVKSVS